MTDNTAFAATLPELDAELADAERAAQLTRLVNLVSGVDMQSADGRAGVSSILREIEGQYPGSIERMAAGLQLARLPTARH